MRFLRVFGPSAVAVAMACVGASSAFATGSSALCAAHEDPCAAVNVYTGHIEGEAKNPELLSSAGNVTCGHSVILGNALGLASPQVTHLELVDFAGECLTESGAPCTVSTVALGLLLLLRTALNLGPLESHGTEVNVKCDPQVDCTYGGSPEIHAEGSEGGGLGTISTNSAALTRTTGSLCPEEAYWDATYSILLPDPVYITASENTVLCKAHEDPCAAGNAYTGHIEGLATNPELLSVVHVTCNHSVILGNALNSTTGGPQVTHLELVNFTGDCLTASGISCTISTVALGLLLLLRTALNLGTLESHGTEVNVHCGAVINCTYGALPVVHAEGSVAGGLGAISANGVKLTRTGGVFCPKEAKWDAVYSILLPDPIYVATSENTVLCKAHEDPCAAGNVYTGHIEGEAKNPELLSSSGDISCDHSIILGNALGSGTPQVTHLEKIEFFGHCFTEGRIPCTVSPVSLGALLLLKTALNLGTLELYNTELNVKCGLDCTFGGLPTVHAEGSVEGGLGIISTNSVALTKTAVALCPKEAHWDAVYSILLPDPIYIST